MSHIIRELLKATNLVLRLENLRILIVTTAQAPVRLEMGTPNTRTMWLHRCTEAKLNQGDFVTTQPTP